MARKEVKKGRILAVALISVALLTLIIGGVLAYLAMSSNITNEFTLAQQPTVTVDGTTVTVDPQGYSVYLRVAIDAAWELDGIQLPEEPTQYAVAEGWKQIGGFYYYPMVISGSEPVTVTPVTYGAAEKDGYQLTVHVAAQIVQAVGSTDEDGIPAVQAAWGVTPEEITAE